MVIPEFGQDEIKPREQSDNEKEYQRIGESEEEPRGEIFPEAVGDILRFLERYRGILLEKIEGERDQDKASENLEQQFVGGNEIRDKRKSQTGQKTVRQVRQGCPTSGKQRRAPPLVESTLDDEHTDRAHRRRNKNADEQPACQYVEQYLH